MEHTVALIHQSFHSWFEHQIRKSGMSQKQLALEIDVSENTVSAWCNGKKTITLANFYSACRVFSKKQNVELESILIDPEYLID